MTRTNPQNPLARRVTDRMTALAIGRTELVRRLGWVKADRGLRRFDEFLATGQPGSHLLVGLAEALGLPADEIGAAVAATQKQIADAEEAAARARFYPHILVLTEGAMDMPFFIRAWAWDEKLLPVPDGFDRLTLVEQVRRAARIVRQHHRKTRGDMGRWGTVVGYHVQCTFDHAVVLNTDGAVREAFNRDGVPPPPEIRIGGKRVPVGVFG